MKKSIVVIILFFIFCAIIWSFFYYKSYIKDIKYKNQTVKQHLSQVKNILEWRQEIPQPGWYKVYYTSTGKLLKKSESYDIVSGLLCSKDFREIWIVVKEPFHKKCYKYSKIKNKKKFQIWWVIKKDWKFQTILTWNVWKSITKDYIKEKLVHNWDTDLPYNPITRYLTAKIQNIRISEDGFVKMIENGGRTVWITQKNYKDYEIKPFTTIVTRWEWTELSIKFENQDILKLEDKSVVKLKDNQVINDKNESSLFWLIGKLTYNVYDSKNLVNIDSPNNSLWIRWDILKGEKTISGDFYKTKIFSNWKNWEFKKEWEHKIKKKDSSINFLFEDSLNKADVSAINLNKIDIENILEVK